MTPSARPATLILASCLLLLLLLLPRGSAAPRCTTYDQPAPKNCKYGTALDWCSNGVCAKGPGETCGGYRRQDGICGEGTYCECGHCRGCSPFDASCHDAQFC
ncbi:neuroparsin-A-like [Portunus trituberculatus]|uniref:Neuroparsin n=1 Tax=Portunus trituberculatus TaxID=210409 RepID=A0A2P1CYC1_PORTR|nr:neuroparsin-A-like [Portunus trituberculatus]AVK43050.1 neuroparsin [Portunus trituberculatus]